ncbi:S46 family peptidase [bacterium]
MKRFIIILALFFSFQWLLADEGMWLLTQIPSLELQKKGLELQNEDIYHPDKPSIAKAIILLGGGTSSFVSSDGLILTNHHVAFEAVQRASTQGTDYLTHGFLAGSRQEEIQAPGYDAQIIIEMQDVTDAVLATAKEFQDAVEREKEIDRTIKTITDQKEEGHDDLNAIVAEMYNGKQYILFVYQRFEDVRIVYMPPLGIGNYGGDIDNWMWPRHTGDFAFMRVYMSPDGKGAKYSEENIPCKPETWLKISTSPLREGDFTFSLGFPGFTTRYRTSNSVRWNLTKTYPRLIKIFGDMVEVLQEATADSPEGKIKVASQIEQLNNVKKNFTGKQEGMTKTHFLNKKIDFEKELMSYLKKDKKLKSEFGTILDDIQAEYALLEKDEARNNFITRIGLSSALFGVADQIYGIAREREKPDDERNPTFSEKDVERTVKMLQYRYMSYYEPADRALLIKALNDALAGDPDHTMTVLDKFIRNESLSIEDFVSQAYQKTKLADLEYAKSLFSKSSKELEALDDPLINMSKNLYETSDAADKQNREFGAKITELRKLYMDALYAWKGSNIYPEANRSIRFSYASVAGYKPRDAVWYEPFTTLSGAVAKHTGERPFDLPEEILELSAKKEYGQWMDEQLKDIPVAFTHKIDDTGGSSGSPVMNAKGQLIGVSFDGNYESMISDWQYDDALTRGIAVDIRYVLFILDKLAHADYLLKELNVK